MYTVIILLVALVVFYFFAYNSMLSSRQKVTESWADIDVQLKRRHDLIPNLVQSVKSYTAYEKSLLVEITDIRTKAMSAPFEDMEKKSTVEKQLGEAIKKIFAVAESYPNLKANENFLKLQEELTNTEDEIASARRIYNDNVAIYNTKISVIPTNIIAKINHYTPYSFFQ